MSQLLIRIDKSLTDASDPLVRAELLARRACYLARIGRFSEVKQTISDLRLHFGDGQNARVTVWIMLLEGISYLFENISPAALDRVNRAQFLSLAIKDRDLSALTSAWKAHIEFERSDFTGMVRSIRTSIENATKDNHDANARLSMVLADAFFLCGDRGPAQTWFMQSRAHALNAGDQATIEALLYNRAAFSVAWLRAERCLGQIDPEVVVLMRLEVASSKNLQDLTQTTALSHLISLCEARLCILEGSYDKAIEGLQAVRNRGPFAAYNFDQHLIDLEIAYCHLKLGDRDHAAAHFGSSRSGDLANLDIDDRLVAQWLRYELSASDAVFGNSEEELANLNRLRLEFNSERRILSEALEEFRVQSPTRAH